MTTGSAGIFIAGNFVEIFLYCNSDVSWFEAMIGFRAVGRASGWPFGGFAPVCLGFLLAANVSILLFY